jgi:hypothetical protein
LLYGVESPPLSLSSPSTPTRCLAAVSLRSINDLTF